METVRRKNIEIPIKYETQVLVVGGGPAGFSAAVTAAREGRDVLLVERGGYLGGMWTLGLVSPFFDNAGKGGLNQEIRRKLIQNNAWGGFNEISFDHCQMILILDEIAQEAGVKMLLYTLAEEAIVDNGKVQGVIAVTKNGPVAIKADIVIDCSGDGTIAADAGAEFKLGRDKDNLTQPMTMMFKVGGLKKSYDKKDILGWYKILAERFPESELLSKIPFNYPAIIKLPRKGEALFQWTHLKFRNGIDPDDLTAATLEGRRQVKYALEYFKSISDILGDVYLLGLPEVIGVRDTRRIIGDYYISDEDVTSGKKFDDAVCKVNFGIDIHEPDKKSQTVVGHNGFYIPYRSLIPAGFDNILVAGRCISGSWLAHAAYRVTGNCVATGEAAGLAAAISCVENCSLRKVPNKKLCQNL
ncbi:MAG: FAD-dependent oxidoreductase [Lentisphaeria bacterium]